MNKKKKQWTDYTDPMTLAQWPLWQGTVALEVTLASQAQFDNTDVVGVVNPEQTWVRTGGPIGGPE